MSFENVDIDNNIMTYIFIQFYAGKQLYNKNRYIRI